MAWRVKYGSGLREKPMEVLALGMPRTGTASMQAALQILGYDPTYHGFTMFSNIGDIKMWQEIVKRKFYPQGNHCSKSFGRTQFDRILGQYKAVCDGPCNIFGPELIAAYPEAKVILVERDVESWFRSYERTVIRTTFNPIHNFVGRLDYQYLGPLNTLSRSWTQGYFYARSEKELRDNARTVYQGHYQFIRDITAKERLLNFDLKDGWKPLCEFLDKPIPDCPFPRVNDAQAFQEKMDLVFRKSLLNIARNFIIVLAGIATLSVTYMYLFGHDSNGE